VGTIKIADVYAAESSFLVSVIKITETDTTTRTSQESVQEMLGIVEMRHARKTCVQIKWGKDIA